MAKRSRQSSANDEESHMYTSEFSIAGTECDTKKKKDHAHREKKRRVDLNTCYGELMALLMQVDPEVGGSLEESDQSKKNLPEIIPVENLLPRRDLVNRAVATIKSLNKENEQLEGFLKERRKRDLEQILRKKENENIRKSPTRLDSVCNNAAQLVDTRKDYHVPQQASIHSNFQQIPINLAKQMKEQLEGLRSFGAYDVAAAAQMNNLFGISQQRVKAITQHDSFHQNLNRPSQFNEPSIVIESQHFDSRDAVATLAGAQVPFPFPASNNNTEQQQTQINNLKQQMDEQALTAYTAFLRDLASHQN